jgi:hypothetical protein
MGRPLQELRMLSKPSHLYIVDFQAFQFLHRRRWSSAEYLEFAFDHLRNIEGKHLIEAQLRTFSFVYRSN